MQKKPRPILARDRSETHRAATELELLFDLVFVVAIALAAVGLHHAIAEAHYIDGIIKFLLAFFALWWPWNHFTWFASAFDNDSPSYRTSVMVMMFGALMIAGGMSGFFESLNFQLMAIGYVILRLAYIFLWHRVGKANPHLGAIYWIISNRIDFPFTWPTRITTKWYGASNDGL